LIGGRDLFMRVMKWDSTQQTYYEQQRIVDPVFGIGYGLSIHFLDNYYRIPVPFGSATGFSIADIDNDGQNEIGVAWGRHFSAFEWTGSKYSLIGRYIVADDIQGTTLDCFVGDYDNDGVNEVLVTGGYNGVASLIAICWDGSEFVKEAEWGQSQIYFPWIADVDNDDLNEIIVGHGRDLVVLSWNGVTFESQVIEQFHDQVFGCVGKDSNDDGINEIHVTFYSPRLCIYRWDGVLYQKIFDQNYPGEEDTIEAIDVGNVDNDAMPEVCLGTDKVHVLQWDGAEYTEEYLIEDTYGMLAVTCVGDLDSDGIMEINAGAVGVSQDQDYKSWIFHFIE